MISKTFTTVQQTPIVQSITKKKSQLLSKIAVPFIIAVTADICGKATRSKENEVAPVRGNTSATSYPTAQRLRSDIRTNNPFETSSKERNNPYFVDRSDNYKINYLS